MWLLWITIDDETFNFQQCQCRITCGHFVSFAHKNRVIKFGRLFTMWFIYEHKKNNAMEKSMVGIRLKIFENFFPFRPKPNNACVSLAVFYWPMKDDSTWNPIKVDQKLDKYLILDCRRIFVFIVPFGHRKSHPKLASGLKKENRAATNKKHINVSRWIEKCTIQLDGSKSHLCIISKRMASDDKC